MFSLRPTSLNESAPKTNEECFGWWIGDAVPESQTEVRRQNERGSKEGHEEEEEEEEEDPDESSSTTSCEEELCQLHSDAALERSCNLVEQKDVELARLDSGFDESHQNRPQCYTPERLVKCRGFRIVTPSPRFLSPLENLAASNKTDLDDKGIEVASRLASLFLDARRNSCRQCCDVRYGDGEVLLQNAHQRESRVPPVPESHFVPYKEFGSCYELRRNLEETSKDQQELSDDTSGVSSADGVTSRALNEDDWSCGAEDPARRLSDESNYVSLEYALTPSHRHRLQKQKSSDISEVVSILAELENYPSRAQALLVEDDRFHSVQSKHDCLGRLALSIEPDDKTPMKRPKDDPEAELDLLYEKIERLQSSGKDIWEEARALRRSFSKSEWKMNHLSDDIKKLHCEFKELRYLDDLLKLLKGDLEEVSKRNWPFVVGHASYGIEEVNLVI